MDRKVRVMNNHISKQKLKQKKSNTNKKSIKPSFNLLKLTRKTHKWLMLFLGVQFVIWSVTGAYMVFFNIDYIHGDSLVKNQHINLIDSEVNFSIQTLLKQYPNAQEIKLESYIYQPVYRFKVGREHFLVNATTGELLSPLNKADAIAVAQSEYTGSGDILSVSLITENPPFELRASALPAWRINFDDFAAPTLYVSATSGKIAGKRHEFWRLFDWIFRFHIMDYQDSEVDNTLLFGFSLFGILAGLSGLILLYFRLFKKNASRLIDNENTLVTKLSKSV